MCGCMARASDGRSQLHLPRSDRDRKGVCRANRKSGGCSRRCVPETCECVRPQPLKPLWVAGVRSYATRGGQHDGRLGLGLHAHRPVAVDLPRPRLTPGVEVRVPAWPDACRVRAEDDQLRDALNMCRPVATGAGAWARPPEGRRGQAPRLLGRVGGRLGGQRARRHRRSGVSLQGPLQTHQGEGPGRGHLVAAPGSQAAHRGRRLPGGRRRHHDPGLASRAGSRLPPEAAVRGRRAPCIRPRAIRPGHIETRVRLQVSEEDPEAGTFPASTKHQPIGGTR
jgi:hypothetical protein